MARVNINILGISELRWTGMGEFNSDDHYINYCGQESLRRNGIAIIVNKRVWNAVLGCSLKNDRMNSVHLQGKLFNITIIQIYAPTSNSEEAEDERFYEDLQDLLESESEVVQSCPTLCDPVDCSLPDSSVHGILQARILDWVAISFSGDLLYPGVQPASPILAGGFFPAAL